MKKFLIFLVLILLIVIVLGGYIGSVVFVKDIRSSRAETMAGKYVANLYKEYSVIGQNCQGEDTNGDSYVSCDLRIQIGQDTSTQKILNLSCPTMWKSFTGNTCKESRAYVPSEN